MLRRNKISAYGYSKLLLFAKKAYLVLAILFLISGCTATKFLKEGESFYTGATIKIKPIGKISGQGELKAELEPLITPEPNGTVLGMRPGVWFYYVAGTPKKKKGFRNFIKTKLGKPPVLLTDATPSSTAQALEGQLNNEGYFKSKVSFEIKTKRKKSKIIYTVDLEKPYRIRNVNYIFLDTAHARLIEEIKKKTLLPENQRYSLARLSAEQQRIEEIAQNKGFYYFDNQHLLFKADSTIGERMVELDLTIEPGMSERATTVYRVKQINVYPNYILTNDSLITKAGDTTLVDGFTYIDNQHSFKPRIITNAINIRPDSIYRRINHEYTLSHLMGLNTFKFVNIKYRRIRGDSAGLRANIYLTPMLKKSFRAQLEGVTKSNNFIGPGLEVSFTNRNLFKGAEMFQLKLNGSYEVQINRKQTIPSNAVEFGGEASVSVPRFITPIKIRYNSAKYLPQTQFKVGYNFRQRLQYFRLNTFNVGTGYTWRETTLKTHELFPIDITFMQKSKTSPEFDSLLNSNPALKNSFQDQFILGANYSFTFNTQLSDEIEEKYLVKKVRKSNFYFNGTLDLSGNIPHALQATKYREDQEPYTFFNSPYSQYVRTTLDFRYYWQLNKRNKIASRVTTGVGYAFGNSDYMPYIKQFAVGGANSLRAFPARSVGPGTYNYYVDENATSSFIDQRGDIKLEGNVEYRFDIINALKGAVFADAGNMWLIKYDSLRPGGQFDRKNLLKEVAVGTGFGLRLDFSFFVLRFDLAFPIRKTYITGYSDIIINGETRTVPLNEFRWAFKDIDFGSKSWRYDNLVFNIAIGYPF